MAEISSPTIEQDIAQLEKQLQEKKALLEHPSDQGNTGEKSESAHETEKELLKTILGEKITQQAPSYQPQQTSQTAPLTGDDTPSYLDPALKDRVDQLV